MRENGGGQEKSRAKRAGGADGEKPGRVGPGVVAAKGGYGIVTEELFLVPCNVSVCNNICACV